MGFNKPTWGAPHCTNHFKGSQTQKPKHRWENGLVPQSCHNLFASSQVLFFFEIAMKTPKATTTNGHQLYLCCWNPNVSQKHPFQLYKFVWTKQQPPFFQMRLFLLQSPWISMKSPSLLPRSPCFADSPALLHAMYRGGPIEESTGQTWNSWKSRRITTKYTTGKQSPNR